MIVSVVPITRLRRATDWWSYKVPSGVSCPVGSLVIVPFRGRPTLGIVWASDDSSTQATEAITQVLCPSLLHAPHRAFVEWLAETGITSLSTALYVWLPSSLRTLPITGPVRTLLTTHATWVAPEKAAAQQLILIPGDRPDIREYIKKSSNWYTLEKQGDSAELASWLSVARGETLMVAGRERALFAPFLNLRQATIVNPEDISYYHEQTPYLSLVTATEATAAASNAHLTVRSHLPAAVCDALWDVQVPQQPLPGQIEFFDTPNLDYLHPALINALQNVIAAHQQALLLINAYDHRITQSDGTRTTLPGVETLRKQLAKALGVSELPPTIHLDTRGMLTKRYERVGLTAVLSLDPLLRQTLFADTLHGLADICTLLSYDAPCYIHARDRSHPLVGAIRNQRLPEYCLDFVHDQQTAALPPFCEQIVCSSSKPDVASDLHEKLRGTVTSPWQLGQPSTVTRRKVARESISLYAPLGTRVTEPMRKLLAALPSPWKIERNPWFTI